MSVKPLTNDQLDELAAGLRVLLEGYNLSGGGLVFFDRAPDDANRVRGFCLVVARPDINDTWQALATKISHLMSQVRVTDTGLLAVNANGGGREAREIH